MSTGLCWCTSTPFASGTPQAPVPPKGHSPTSPIGSCWRLYEGSSWPIDSDERSTNGGRQSMGSIGRGPSPSPHGVLHFRGGLLSWVYPVEVLQPYLGSEDEQNILASKCSSSKQQQQAAASKQQTHQS